MVREAEEYASADAARKEGIEAKNEADTLIYSAERSLSEHKDKVPQEVATGVTTAIAELRDVMEKGEAAVIREKVSALQTAMMKIGEHLNRASSGDGGSGDNKENKDEEKK